MKPTGYGRYSSVAPEQPEEAGGPRQRSLDHPAPGLQNKTTRDRVR